MNDVRPGAPPQDPKSQQFLTKTYGDDVYQRSLILCSGMDMVNISMVNVIFKDVKTKDVRITKREIRYLKIFNHAAIVEMEGCYSKADK